jgi:beta-xylosidase
MTSTQMGRPDPAGTEQDGRREPWKDTTLGVEERVDALLARMTSREKLQQLGSTWPDAEGAAGDVAPLQETLQRAAPVDVAMRDGLGQLTRVFGTAPITAADGRRKLVGLQERVVATNRFGIPAIAHEECLTGFTAWTATVYPTPLAWAASNDPELVERMAAAIGADMRALGIHQGLAPVLDVVRDYRWGRVEETMGEDPSLVGELGTAYVRGLQSSGVIATLKHFAGYSASRGARNHAPVAIGPRELADIVLPPFEQAVIEGGAGSVMNSYADLDGSPPASDRGLLTGILREKWGFEGTVVSDYWAVPFLESTHHVAADSTEAGAMALEAGMDVELPHTLGFGDGLLAAIEAGDVPVELLDRAARRVLRQKIELGLLDPTWTPEGDGQETRELDSLANRALARTLAEESVIVLANDGEILPMGAPGSIAVIGPGANDAGCLFGCYSFPNHVLASAPDVELGIAAPTVLDAIRAEFATSEVRFEPGVPILSDDRSGLADAVALAVDSDVTVLVVGDRSGMFGHGTSGEGCDVTTLALPGIQEELVAAVIAAARRVVLVVLSGRPYAIGEHADRSDAAIQVFFPGEEGAGAIAGVLSGRVLPSGRLPVQIPGARASQPGTYLAPPLALKSDGVSNIDPSPAFAFGHGLSLSELTIEGVVADSAGMTTDGTVLISARIGNVGTRDAWHVPQLYLTDPVSSITRPVRIRLAAQRVRLAVGETAVVEFEVHADLLAFTGADLRRRVEPGRVIFTVAQSAGDPGRAVQVDVTGDVRYPGSGRRRSAIVAVRRAE